MVSKKNSTPGANEPLRQQTELKEPPVVLSAVDVSYSYKQGDQSISALSCLSLNLRKNEMIAIVGQSGCGKSTLLHLLGLLDNVQSGEIYIRKEENAPPSLFPTSKLSEQERTLIRRHSIGFVYQFHHLLKEFTALENVMLAQIIAGASKKAAENNAMRLLSLVGLSNRAQHKPHQLSGGQQQRVAIARALANSPQILIADEPTGNLDESTSEDVFNILLSLCSNNGMSVVMATHNTHLCKRFHKTLRLDIS
ncbi:ABC transporter ATP-binding protein [Candidatus Hydrogenosomobacter endosymbioticus]|uniref:Lipoprotein-releasing system ATP-binding protein LolD n=1 Tax=Candidatus Hydrogenosomobacter endosymbioticus TaxID=2558174 RepID=A0ABN6L214_9PROT|nr:ABC transporter ATP-binding protein [Candidatus Hydrogenosomobacter endosymbioticus]BDB95871.1 lipoprotein-releasing system ATP-binding protein LolD [Candidatus Hydrogenosomobacter endosymbioticus]